MKTASERATCRRVEPRDHMERGRQRLFLGLRSKETPTDAYFPGVPSPEQRASLDRTAFLLKCSAFNLCFFRVGGPARVGTEHLELHRDFSEMVQRPRYGFVRYSPIHVEVKPIATGTPH